MLYSKLLDLVGKYFGEDKPPEELGDPIDFKPGFMTDCGILYVRVSKNNPSLLG